MAEFISEPIRPEPGTFETAAMSTGLPGLPRGFTWRGVAYQVEEQLEAWKASAPEGGRPGGERYLRRHYFRLRISGGAIWTVYFVRQAPRSGSAKLRWFLYLVERR